MAVLVKVYKFFYNDTRIAGVSAWQSSIKEIKRERELYEFISNYAGG